MLDVRKQQRYLSGKTRETESARSQESQLDSGVSSVYIWGSGQLEMWQDGNRGKFSTVKVVLDNEDGKLDRK